MANLDIKNKLKEMKVTQWKLADKLNIGETTLVRKLRKELDKNEKQKILKIILDLSKEGEN